MSKTAKWDGSKVKGRRVGDLQLVDNQNRKPAAAARYNHSFQKFPDGVKRHLLFTDHEIKRALARAQKNPEDLPIWSWVRMAACKLSGLVK